MWHECSPVGAATTNKSIFNVSFFVDFNFYEFAEWTPSCHSNNALFCRPNILWASQMIHNWFVYQVDTPWVSSLGDHPYQVRGHVHIQLDSVNFWNYALLFFEIIFFLSFHLLGLPYPCPHSTTCPHSDPCPHSTPCPSSSPYPPPLPIVKQMLQTYEPVKVLFIFPTSSPQQWWTRKGLIVSKTKSLMTRVLEVLSCYMSLYLNHFETKRDLLCPTWIHPWHNQRVHSYALQFSMIQQQVQIYRPNSLNT